MVILNVHFAATWRIFEKLLLHFPYQYVTIFVWFTSIKRDVSSKEMKHLKNIASIQPCLLSDVYLEEFKWSLRRANMHQLWSMSVLFAKRLLLIQNFREVKDKSETYFHASNVSQSWSQTWEDQHGGGDKALFSEVEAHIISFVGHCDPHHLSRTV